MFFNVFLSKSKWQEKVVISFHGDYLMNVCRGTAQLICALFVHRGYVC